MACEVRMVARAGGARVVAVAGQRTDDAIIGLGLAVPAGAQRPAREDASARGAMAAGHGAGLGADRVDGVEAGSRSVLAHQRASDPVGGLVELAVPHALRRR